MHSQDHQVGQDGAWLSRLRRRLSLRVIDHSRNLDIVAQSIAQVLCEDIGVDHFLSAVECQDEDIQR